MGWARSRKAFLLLCHAVPEGSLAVRLALNAAGGWARLELGPALRLVRHLESSRKLCSASHLSSTAILTTWTVELNMVTEQGLQ